MLQPYSIANEDLTTPQGRARLELLIEMLFANIGLSTGLTAGVVWYGSTPPATENRTDGMLWYKNDETNVAIMWRAWNSNDSTWRTIRMGGIVT